MSLFESSSEAKKIIEANSAESTVLSCPVHGEYGGYMMMIQGREHTSECPTCADERIAEERKQMIERHKKRVKSASKLNKTIPNRYLHKSIKDWETPTKEALEVKKLMVRYIKEFDRAMKMGTCFLFSGATRTGKTHLACSVVNNLTRLGRSAGYVNTMTFTRRMKISWVAGSKISEEEVLESFVKPFDLLVVDELGKGQLGPKEKGMLFHLLDRRSEENLPTIGITKYPDKKLYQLIDDDAVSRLIRGGGRILHFDWANYEDKQERF